MENQDSSQKEEEDFESKINKMIDTFTKAETKNKENSPKYLNWIKEISSPQFKLISNLLNYFLDDLTSTNMRENIFKIMRKLYQLNPQVVAPQIQSNKDFAKAIVVHINSGDKSKINKMIDTFTKAETKNKENSTKYLNWIKEISSPQFKLISNLLNYFLDDLTSTNMRENIFKIMRKLYQLNPKVVAPQIQSNKDFAKAIVVHINSGDKSKITDNGFYLLTQLFNKAAYKEELNEEFIAALFEGLGLVREEDILIAIVVILIDINF
jgi:predicted SPOUT superfamily RNA methylase MTH1